MKEYRKATFHTSHEAKKHDVFLIQEVLLTHIIMHRKNI